MAHTAADGAVVPARTWPFTASRVPASAYRTIHGACHTCDGVRDRLWLTRLLTELSYLRVRGRSLQAVYLHRHTGPFTAHVVSATAYMAVHGTPRTCVGVQDRPLRMSYECVHGHPRRMSYLRCRTIRSRRMSYQHRRTGHPWSMSYLR